MRICLYMRRRHGHLVCPNQCARSRRGSCITLDCVLSLSLSLCVGFSLPPCGVCQGFRILKNPGKKSERNGRNGNPRNSGSGNRNARLGISVGFGRPAAMAAAFLYGDWGPRSRERVASRESSSLAGALSWTSSGGVMRYDGRELNTGLLSRQGARRQPGTPRRAHTCPAGE